LIITLYLIPETVIGNLVSYWLLYKCVQIIWRPNDMYKKEGKIKVFYLSSFDGEWAAHYNIVL